MKYSGSQKHPLISQPTEVLPQPLKIINKYKGCKLPRSKSKLESLELGSVWKYIFGMNLNRAHDALIDAIAQMGIVTSDYFFDYIIVTKSLQLIEEIFSKTEQHEMAKGL